jgi:hypothetical protein
MSNENIDKTKTSGEQAGSKAGELNDADLQSVAGGIVAVGRRSAPIPNDGRSIAGSPVPEDGRGITGEPVPEDGKLSIG